MAFTFTKQERLCSKVFIARLFEKGNPRTNGFPFRISWVYVTLEGDFPAQVLFLVSKKNIPLASQRNRIKRQLRELYRLNKESLYAKLRGKNKQLILSVSFLGNKPLHMKELEPLFLQHFNKMIHELA